LAGTALAAPILDERYTKDKLRFKMPSKLGSNWSIMAFLCFRIR